MAAFDSSLAYMSFPEIAQELGLSPDQVANIYRGAMMKLRKNKAVGGLRLLARCRADLRRQMRLSESPLGTE